MNTNILRFLRLIFFCKFVQFKAKIIPFQLSFFKNFQIAEKRRKIQKSPNNPYKIIITSYPVVDYFIKLLTRDEFIRFRNCKNRVAIRFRVRCVSAFTPIEHLYLPSFTLSGAPPVWKVADWRAHVFCSYCSNFSLTSAGISTSCKLAISGAGSSPIKSWTRFSMGLATRSSVSHLCSSRIIT